MLFGRVTSSPMKNSTSVGPSNVLPLMGAMRHSVRIETSWLLGHSDCPACLGCSGVDLCRCEHSLLYLSTNSRKRFGFMTLWRVRVDLQMGGGFNVSHIGGLSVEESAANPRFLCFWWTIIGALFLSGWKEKTLVDSIFFYSIVDNSIDYFSIVKIIVLYEYP
ncbi:hypothetical protein AVEN_234234-1 [Araneus ventricosus]|uniref:Uncharacterized protein n=1 Tax=Araneus ventricosus TaxID=182803 RepID=A0A4Y2A7T0_ARAVE|nr:hypothetical protein AVEN_234234-1 [Araneus ventricosus]